MHLIEKIETFLNILSKSEPVGPNVTDVILHLNYASSIIA